MEYSWSYKLIEVRSLFQPSRLNIESFRYFLGLNRPSRQRRISPNCQRYPMLGFWLFGENYRYIYGARRQGGTPFKISDFQKRNHLHACSATSLGIAFSSFFSEINSKKSKKGNLRFNFFYLVFSNQHVYFRTTILKIRKQNHQIHATIRWSYRYRIWFLSKKITGKCNTFRFCY